MKNDKRSDPRYWEKSIRLFLKEGNSKEKIEVDNLSYSGVGFTFPVKRRIFKIGERINLLLQVGNETTIFSTTIKWVSESAKKVKNYEVLKYGVKNNLATHTNLNLWKDYTTFLMLNNRFSGAVN